MKITRVLAAFMVLFALCQPRAKAQQQEGDLSALLGGVVQSDSWIIRKEKFEEEFTGNVRYKNDIYDIRADKALSKRKEQSYLLGGNVSASRSQDGVKARITAQKFFYNKLKDEGYALCGKNKQISAVYETGGASYKLYGDRFDFSNKFTLYKITGHAELDDLNNTLYARQITFNNVTGVFEASGGRPLFWGFSDDGDYALQADAIIAATKEGRVTAKGRVQGWVTAAKDFKNLQALKGK
jgi:lipopolysaccharide export system protein LptA